jgi:hypothetical protein
MYEKLFKIKEKPPARQNKNPALKIQIFKMDNCALFGFGSNCSKLQIKR